LFDCHAHTSDLSYCCDAEITPQTYLKALAVTPEVEGIAITNHGFATYFPEEIAWGAEYMLKPELFDQYREFGNQRLNHHLLTMEALRGRGLYTGIEVEMMIDGRLTLDDNFRGRLDVIIGSVHFMPEIDVAAQSPEEVEIRWWDHVERMATRGINILGHPFRWIHKAGRLPITQDMVERMVALASREFIAIEINAHSRIPGDLELLKACAKAGVTIAFGSDSHSADEIGNLSYQLHLVRQAGLTLDDIRLWRPASHDDT